MVIWNGKAWKSALSGGGRGTVGVTPRPEEEGNMTDFLTGTEIDTGDTLDGATIYAKIIDFGAMPNTGTKNVAHSITGVTRWLDVFGVAYNSTGDGGFPMAYDTGGVAQFSLRVNGTNIVITTISDRSAETARVFLLYLK